MERVVKRDQLIQYLEQQSNAEVDFLQFEGANQVVYRTQVEDFGEEEEEEENHEGGCCSLGDSHFSASILKWINMCLV
jgi:hypothetical protein